MPTPFTILRTAAVLLSLLLAACEPAAPERLSFAALGSTGTGGLGQRAVAQSVAATGRDDGLDLVLLKPQLSGDLADGTRVGGLGDLDVGEHARSAFGCGQACFRQPTGSNHCSFKYHLKRGCCRERISILYLCIGIFLVSEQ